MYYAVIFAQLTYNLPLCTMYSKYVLSIKCHYFDKWNHFFAYLCLILGYIVTENKWKHIGARYPKSVSKQITVYTKGPGKMNVTYECIFSQACKTFLVFCASKNAIKLSCSYKLPWWKNMRVLYCSSQIRGTRDFRQYQSKLP